MATFGMHTLRSAFVCTVRQLYTQALALVAGPTAGACAS